jgi:hypothetical protein
MIPTTPSRGSHKAPLTAALGVQRTKQMDEIDFVVEALKAGDIFFFAGSGISYASNLPSAYAVLEHTVKAFLPDHISENEKRDICSGIQPEVFYESIIGITRSYDCLDIWRSLYKDEQKNHHLDGKGGQVLKNKYWYGKLFTLWPDL